MAGCVEYGAGQGVAGRDKVGQGGAGRGGPSRAGPRRGARAADRGGGGGINQGANPLRL